jgi:peptide/nickel transport system ATP-binding protein
MSTPLLMVSGLKTYFYSVEGVVRAVDGMSFEVNERESVGLVGESGCGKSTAALSVMRLVSPPGKVVSGRISFRARNLLDMRERDMDAIRGKELAMVFQDPMTFLNPVMKIEDQIAEAIIFHERVSKQRARPMVIEALKKVSMPSPEKVAKYYPHQLSGGMRQRVLIAIAYSCNPSLLIADEPTSLLDVTIQAQIIDLIRELKDKNRTALMLITHDLGVVAELCERVYVMYAGKIVESASVFEIFETAKHPYTQGLLNSVLSIDRYARHFRFIAGDVPDLIAPPSGCRFQPRCPKAMDICLKTEPQLREVTTGHRVSCFLYE